MSEKRRVRVFIGPNGSGKSTIAKSILSSFPAPFVNADEIEQALSTSRRVSLPQDLSWSREELFSFLNSSTQFSLGNYPSPDGLFIETDEELFLNSNQSPSYLSAALAEFTRLKYREHGLTFAFESVFSHPSKLSELSSLVQSGYRIYLYVVCLADVEMNLERIGIRVEQGGHNVAATKVRDRYERFIELLPEALQYAYRAFIFDNSLPQAECAHFATYTGDSGELLFVEDWVPEWFIRAFGSAFVASEGTLGESLEDHIRRLNG